MFVITHNNQNYDSGGEYPIGYKNTEKEATAFCELSKIKLREYEKRTGVVVILNFKSDMSKTPQFNEVLNYFKNASFTKEEVYLDNIIYTFFIEDITYEVIDKYIRAYKINGNSPFHASSIYKRNLAYFKGFDEYSDFYFYEVKELGDSI